MHSGKITRQTGQTLTEVLLVLTIAAMITVLGIRGYNYFARDTDIRQVQFSVDALFKAASRYYQANCYGSTNPSTGIVTNSVLPPSTATNQYTAVNIKSQLISAGFLTDKITPDYTASTITPGPIVSSYVVQLNRKAQARRICTAGTNATGPNASQGCTTASDTGMMLSYTIQVAAEVTDSASAETYRRMLNGDCLSSANGSLIYTCAQNQPGNYIVWERLPSFTSLSAGQESDYWVSNPSANQFNQMYRTYPINYLLSNNPAGTTTSSTQYQYYQCGN